MLQETHGSLQTLDIYFRLFFKRFHIDTSFYESKAGLITFINKSVFPNPQFLKPVIFQDGRIMKSQIVCNSFSVILYNFHNYELINADFLLFKTSLNKDVELSVS